MKKLLYVLRTALTGVHLLRTGELETDVTRLVDDHNLASARDLVEAKRAGERTAANPALLDAWRPELARVLSDLDASWRQTVLPEEPPEDALGALEAWLVALRRSHF